MTATTDTPVAKRRGSLALNFLLLSGGEILGKALTFAAFVFLGRVLGPERYGSLEFVLASMVFFTLPVDFGIGIYGACELAKNRERATDLLREVAATRLALGVLSFLILLGVALVLPKPGEVKLLLVVCGFGLLAEPVLLQWFFQAHDRMQGVALATLTRKGTFATLVFLLIRSDSPLLFVGLCEVVSVAATALVCLAMLRLGMKRGMPLPVANLGRLIGHFRKAAPIGLSELAWVVMWYSGTVLLGLLVGGESLGWFGASHRVVMALHTFVWLYFFNMLPSLSRTAQQLGTLRELLHRSLALTTWGGLLIALIPTLAGSDLLTLVYGPRFAEAGTPFALLAWMIPIALLSGHYRYTLIASGLQKLEFYATLAAALVSPVLGLALIPWYGISGAAIALLVANLMNLILAYYFVTRFIASIPCHEQLIQPVLSLMASLLIYHVIQPIHHWGAIGAALLIYLIPFSFWGWRTFGILIAGNTAMVAVTPKVSQGVS